MSTPIPVHSTTEAMTSSMDGMECRSVSPPQFSLSSEPAFSAPAGETCEMPATPADAEMSGGETSGEVNMSIDPTFTPGPVHVPICVDDNPSAGPEWDEFARRFNGEFSSIMHVFETDTAGCSPEVPNGLSGGQLSRLFSDSQRQKLMNFFDSRLIPNRLFNGDDIGGTNAQQRILMSGHILATGRYIPGSFEQRLHARMCFHWVRLVHHYAGASPARGILESGVMGNFDHEGNLVLGSGETEGVFGRRRATAGEASTPNGTRTMPFAELNNTLQPGDWIYYYNANGGPTAAGNHSVIFSHWADAAPTSVSGNTYRTAIVFSQNRTSTGGNEHRAKLGDRYDGALDIFPVVNISRVNEGANSATDYHSLFPEGGNAATRNASYIERAERTLRFRIDPNLILTTLREENRGHIDFLSQDRGEERGGIITPGQRQMLESANADSDLEVVIRLTERLRQWRHNAGVLATNMANTYDGDLDERHRAETERVNAELAPIDQELHEIEEDLRPIEEQLLTLSQRSDALNIYPRIQELRRRVRAIDAERATLGRRDPRRAELSAERSGIIAQITDLSAEFSGSRDQRNDIRDQIRDLRRTSSRARARRDRLERDRRGIVATLPEGMVHPGNMRGVDDREASTGQLSSIFPNVRDLRPFLTSEPYVRPAASGRGSRR